MGRVALHRFAATPEIAVEILGLGTVTMDDRFKEYVSAPVTVHALGGHKCKIVIEGYDADSNKDEIHTAIANFLSSTPAVLKEAEPHVFSYYDDMKEFWQQDAESFVELKSPSEVWAHVQFGGEAIVSRRRNGDKGVYISLECNCDWEPEHGLQIVFRNGNRVNKVGPYDGHLTNANAYADPDLEDVVYKRLG